eukprot:5829141-Pyramimonas_sp.AAC.1
MPSALRTARNPSSLPPPSLEGGAPSEGIARMTPGFRQHLKRPLRGLCGWQDWTGHSRIRFE